MKVTYELTRDDLAAFLEHYQQSSPSLRRQKIGCLVIGFCALMILPGGILLTTDKPRLETAWDIWPLLLGPILFAITALPIARWRTRRLSNRLLGEGKNQGFYGRCQLELGAGAITETRPSGSTSRHWTSVEQVVIAPCHLFIYTSGHEAFVVPRSAFPGEAELHRFLDTIAERSGVEPHIYD